MQNCENQSPQLNGFNVMHGRIAQVALTLPSIVIRRTQPTKLCPAGAVGPRFASPAMFGCPPRYKFLFRFNCVRNPNAVPVTATPSTVKVPEENHNNHNLIIIGLSFSTQISSTMPNPAVGFVINFPGKLIFQHQFMKENSSRGDSTIPSHKNTKQYKKKENKKKQPLLLLPVFWSLCLLLAFVKQLWTKPKYSYMLMKRGLLPDKALQHLFFSLFFAPPPPHLDKKTRSLQISLKKREGALCAC